MDNQELIWVDKDFAEKHKVLLKDKTKRDLQVKVFDDYLEKIKESSKSEFKTNFENLKEDVAIYTGLMLKVKQAFEKAKDEQLSASYTLWEKFEKEMPFAKEKIATIISELNPLQEKLKQISDLIAKINTWNIDKLSESIRNLSEVHGKNKEMVEFLVNNFKQKEAR